MRISDLYTTNIQNNYTMEANNFSVPYNVDFNNVEMLAKKREKTSSSSLLLKIYNKVQNLKNLPSIVDNSDIVGLIPNQEEMLWIHRETSLATKKGNMHIHYFYDGFTNKMVGFSLANNNDETGLVNALTMALGYRKTNRNLIINHSGKKLKHFSKDYTNLFAVNNIRINFTDIN